MNSKKVLTRVCRHGITGLTTETRTQEVVKMTTSELEVFIDANEWVFAKTMPKTPHYYCRRTQANFMPFRKFVSAIYGQGKKENFMGREYIYLNIGKWQYWAMGLAPEKTTIINRAVIKEK